MDFDHQKSSQKKSAPDSNNLPNSEYAQQKRVIQKKLIWSSLAVLVFSVLSVGQMNKLDNFGQKAGSLTANQPETYILTPDNNTNIVVSQRDTYRDGDQLASPASLISDNVLHKSGKRFVASHTFLNWNASNNRSQWSSFSITNAENTAANVTLRFYDMEGRRIGTDEDHRFTVDPNQRVGTYRSLDDIVAGAIANGGKYADNNAFLGSVVIVSDKNISVTQRDRLTENRTNDLANNEHQKVSTLSDIPLSPASEYSNTYNSPLFLLKHGTGIGDTRTQWTNFIIANAGDQITDLTIKIFNKDGLLKKTLSDTSLDPHASFSTYGNSDLLSALDGETVGTVEISSSTTNIVVSQRDTYRDGDQLASPASLISDNVLHKSGKRFVASHTFLNWNASNNRSQWSSFSITNAENTAANVTLRFYDMEGRRIGTDEDHRFTVDPNQRVGTYRSLDDIVAGAIANGGKYADNNAFLGSVVIVSDKNISVTQRDRLTENRTNDLANNEHQKVSTLSDIPLSPASEYSNTYNSPLFLLKHGTGIGDTRTQWTNFIIANAGDQTQRLSLDVYDKLGLFMKRIYHVLNPHASFSTYGNSDLLSALGGETVGTVKIIADKNSGHLWSYDCDHPRGGPCQINYIEYINTDLDRVNQDDANPVWADIPKDVDASSAYYDYSLSKIRVYLYKGDKVWHYRYDHTNGAVAIYEKTLLDNFAELNSDSIFDGHHIPAENIDASVSYMYPKDPNQPLSASNEMVAVTIYKGGRLWEYRCDVGTDSPSCQATRTAYLSNNFGSIDNQQSAWDANPIPGSDIDAATAFYVPDDNSVRVFIYKGDKVWNYDCGLNDGSSCTANYVQTLDQSLALGAVDSQKDNLKNQPLPMSNLSAVSTYWNLVDGGNNKITATIYDSPSSAFDTGACEENARRCSGEILQICTNKEFVNHENCADSYASCSDAGDAAALCEVEYTPCTALEENAWRCSDKYPQAREQCMLSDDGGYVWTRYAPEQKFSDGTYVNCFNSQICSYEEGGPVCVPTPADADKCTLGSYSCSTDGNVLSCQSNGVFNLDKTCEAGTSCDSNTGGCVGGGTTVTTSDLNGDGTVGVADLRLLIGDWGGSTYDLDGDGTVGVSDLRILIGDWGTVQ